ncbi:protein ITPRID1 [Leptodactylus fuscus]|uniref:protein ITPRID1 n=1 Tax=Leptodactylus fuscus TaxID=238119 RepID=UPI003F4EDEE7
MGIIKLSVKDYMSSLHNYIEKFPIARSDGTNKPSPSVPTSISDMLKLCEADPVDLLIDLGFGIDEPDICNKIPSRFIMTPSGARGINTRVFLEAQKKRMEIEHPNLCGRFRQLEVLEQVTSAFSSLLNDIHTIPINGGQKAYSERKSTLTPEKRRRIRQLLWKFSKQVKIVDENINPCMNNAEQQDTKEDQENLGKGKRSTEESSLVTLSTRDNGNTSDGQASHLCAVSTPIKESNHPKGVLKTFKKSDRQRLQPSDPESFEMEEVQSFEEDCPRAMNQGSISEMARTNSCQSDSSGFQEEPPEPLPLQNLHESSDSNDSQTTLREKTDFSVSYDESQEYDVTHYTEPVETKKEKYKPQKSLSMNTENSDDVFQSFDNDDKDNIHETEDEERTPGDPRNEALANRDGCLLLHEVDGSVIEDQEQSPEVPSEVNFPVYVTHYLSDIRESFPETFGEINDSVIPDFLEEGVSDLQKSDSERDSFADDECSVELSNLKWTPSPTCDIHSYSLDDHTPERSVYHSDAELNTSDQDKKTTFQTEINTNIYKSVTIQMSSSQLQDTNDGSNRPTNVYNTHTNRSEVHALLQCGIEGKEAYSQTDMGWWNECTTNHHCSHQRSRYLTESQSFDTAAWPPLHSPCSPLSTHCCHCCHCHHCCTQQSTRYRHNVSTRPTVQSNLERELSDTLKLLRESLITISLNTDQDVENMKQACQKYREKLTEIEQHLSEQQAGCYNIFTREERENMRRLHLLRQKVLKEAIELEFNLDARARLVKETIAMQLEEVLEEQSRLYSDLEFYNWEQDKNSREHCASLQRTQSLPSTPSLHETDQSTPVTQEESRTQSQKIDLTTILEHIKKTFRSFNNS